MRTLLFLFLMVQSLILKASAADCLSIGVAAGAGATEEIMDIVREAGRRAGLCLDPIRAPQNRFAELHLDGEVLPLADPLPADSPMTALPTPLASFTGTLYWPVDRPEPAGPGTLIGVVLGQDWAARDAIQRGAKPFAVRDNKQLFAMMAAGRLDGMILPSLSYRHFLARYPALPACSAKPLAELPVLFLLDRRHAAMAPALDRAVAALRRDGFIEKKFRKYEH